MLVIIPIRTSIGYLEFRKLFIRLHMICAILSFVWRDYHIYSNLLSGLFCGIWHASPGA